jgi:mono/diheme cytochrome c family protein
MRAAARGRGRIARCYGKVAKLRCKLSFPILIFEVATLKFLAGLILGLIAVPLGVYFYFVSGSAPVATAAQAMPFEKMLAHKALDARVAKEMPHNVPMAADESAYRAGAQIYRDNCVVCHSFSDGNPGPIAKGMFPRPPKLLQGMGVTDDEPEETYWKVANGIRLTGMPAFNQSLSQDQIWQVSLLLANANKLPDSVKALLTTLQNPPAIGSIVPISGH